MLFMNLTPVDIEATKYKSYSIPNQKAAKKNLRNIVFTVTGFYILVSCVAVIFYPPMSSMTLIIPFVTLFLSICAAKSTRNDAFWPCIFLAIIGFLLKLVGCIVFMSVFEFKVDVKKMLNLMFLLEKKVNDGYDYNSNMRINFFYILTGSEIFFFIVSCCIRWHLFAFEVV